jgi:hypothetical protein
LETSSFIICEPLLVDKTGNAKGTRMKNIIVTFTILALLLAACSAVSPPDPTPWPETVDWETAVEILNSGHVVGVAQLHNLTVYLDMDDGSQITTVEPAIDEIFNEIAKCGQPCEGMVLATE